MFRFLLCLFHSLVLFATLSAQPTVGLIHFSDNAYDGYTLFAPLQNTTTYLIDNCGNLVHQWESDNNPGSVVYLLEDGSLLRVERLNGQGFNSGGKGGRIKRIDWEGNTIWQYDLADANQHQHHDVEVLPNGNILAIAWERKTDEEAIAAGRNPMFLGSELWPDKVVELEPVGTDSANIVWEWHIWDHLIQDFDNTKANFGVVGDHPELIDINYIGNVPPSANIDWVHFNSVDYNADLDQILLSSRHFQEILVIDHSTTTEEAAGHTGGNSGKGGDILYRWGNPSVYNRGNANDTRLYFQHDASWIPEGRPGAGMIMVFNNGLNRPGGNYSSVDVIDPPVDEQGNYLLEEDTFYGPTSTSWTYIAPLPNAFYSINISGAQRLSNGNTLICEGNDGRIFEVKLDGTLLWEYINPVNNNGPVTQGNNSGANQVFRAYRYGADFPGLVGRDLSPGQPIELEPLPSDCIISDLDEVADSELRVYPNPARQLLRLERNRNKKTMVNLINASGQIIKTTLWEGYSLEWNISSLPAGLYFLQWGREQIEKIIISD